ncbi:hypothetical protein PIB30_060345 [Stylosanthes scabra]|uniref:Uncharacterized protein n=1 Tax=Stylosanthes scabra TaxID=79078 RepID=A0ABU6YIR8_9FABA|nr:hypothetical protein [Stylosanthes scabra]
MVTILLGSLHHRAHQFQGSKGVSSRSRANIEVAITTLFAGTQFDPTRSGRVGMSRVAGGLNDGRDGIGLNVEGKRQRAKMILVVAVRFWLVRVVHQSIGRAVHGSD